MTFDPLRQVKPFRVYKLSQLNPKVDIVSLHYMLIGMIVVDDQTIIEAEYIGLYFLWSASQGDWWVTDYRRQNIDKALMSLNSCFSSFWLQIKEESVSRFFVRVMQIQVFFSLQFHFILISIILFKVIGFSMSTYLYYDFRLFEISSNGIDHCFINSRHTCW